MLHLFVYGTLKRGFPLHGEGLRDARYLGPCRTSEPYPMVIAGPWFGPMMIDSPGIGLPVEGELYEIEESRLPTIDRLEAMGQPGNFRTMVTVQPSNHAREIEAVVYTKSWDIAEPRHSGYLGDYQDRRFIPSWER